MEQKAIKNITKHTIIGIILCLCGAGGLFYLFVNTQEVSNDSIEFCKELLQETGVAVVPGIGFGSEGYFRFSFATDIDTIREGISRIKKFVESKKA